MSFKFIGIYGLCILTCLSYSVSDEFPPVPSKDLSTARCRISCLETDSEVLRINQSESCSSFLSCATCWRTCALLYHETSIWSPMCNATRICKGGCSTACKYWLLHKNEDSITNLSGDYKYSRKPISLLNADRTFMYWSVPTAVDGSHNNSTIIYAIFIEESSGKNPPGAKHWKQVEQTLSVSAILFCILPIHRIRLVAITEEEILADAYFQSKYISFPEFFSHTGVLDDGFLQINEFLWTSPRSPVSTIIQEIPNGRVQAAISWQDTMQEHGTRSVYKVLWRMLSCHVYRSLDPCDLHGHFNVTLVSVSKYVQAQLDINLRFNSEYVIQVEKIVLGVGKAKEVTDSNVDAALIIVQTPRCETPDSSFFICNSLLIPKETTKTAAETGTETTLNWLVIVTVMFGVFILACVMVAICWNKTISDSARNKSIASLKNRNNNPYWIEISEVNPRLDWNQTLLADSSDSPAKSIYDLIAGHYADKPALFKGVNEKSSWADWQALSSESTQMQKLNSNLNDYQQRRRHVIQLIGSLVAKRTLVLVFNCESNLRLSDYLQLFTAEISYPTLDGVSCDSFLSTSNLVWFSQQIADGMCFLSSMCITHQYLSCSNILVTSQNILKLCNIGVTFPTATKRPAIDNKFLWKWMAPEILSNGFYTTFADIWSFGILLWELFTLGDIPYADYNNEDLYAVLAKGYRLPRTRHCPDFIYDLMNRCWQMRVSSRPLFEQLARELITGARTLVINDHFRRKYTSAISTCNEVESAKLAPKLLASRLKDIPPPLQLWHPKGDHSNLGSFQRSSSLDTLLSPIESDSAVNIRVKPKIIETKFSFPW